MDVHYDPTDGSWSVFADLAARNTRGLAVDGDGFVWVANSATNNVSKFRSEDGALVGTYAAGSGPIGVGIDPEGNVWVINETDDDVTAQTLTLAHPRADLLQGHVAALLGVVELPAAVALDESDHVLPPLECAAVRHPQRHL